MSGSITASNVLSLDHYRWRRPRRPPSRLQRSLARLERDQLDAAIELLEVFAPLAEVFWRDLVDQWPSGDGEVGVLPVRGVPLAEIGQEGLIALCLEAGYTVGTADTFKAVLPHFLTAALAWPLESWVIDPDLLRAKLETLSFETWPARERRAVARALAAYAQHELQMAEGGSGAIDEAIIAAKSWAEQAFAAAR